MIHLESLYVQQHVLFVQYIRLTIATSKYINLLQTRYFPQNQRSRSEVFTEVLYRVATGEHELQPINMDNE